MTHEQPAGTPLASQQIHEILGFIATEAKHRHFSYHGHNRDKETLLQLNLVMLMAQKRAAYRFAITEPLETSPTSRL